MDPLARRLAQSSAIISILLAAPSLAQAETLQGMIISHVGDTIVVRGSGGDRSVTLTSATKIQAISGLLGGQREDHPPSDLINGLAVNVEIPDGAVEAYAEKITFKPSDLKTAMAISAGTDQAKQRLLTARERALAAQAENQRRFSQIGQFTTKAKMRVLFATGSASIAAQGRQDLQAFCGQATAYPGGLLRVVGHTDSTGSATTNQRLSAQRASAVTAYLVQNCNIPSERIMSPSSMSSYTPIDDDTTPASLAENRRVTVYVLVSKASEPAPS
jgi:OmpA-OmpF porin, OOP family